MSIKMSPARYGALSQPKKMRGSKKYLGTQSMPMSDSNRTMRNIRPGVCLNISLIFSSPNF
jgi:hypothetical protein